MIMKSKTLFGLTQIALLLVCFTLRAQNTNWLDSPLLKFASQSNLVVVGYGMYDETDGSIGGGAAIGYKLNDFVVPTLRLDYVHGEVFAPSGSLQLQAPFNIRNFKVTPFVFTGVATPLNTSKVGGAIGIFGVGGYIVFPDGPWWRPDVLIVDYERWTGAGFNDKQWRFGPAWKF